MLHLEEDLQPIHRKQNVITSSYNWPVKVRARCCLFATGLVDIFKSTSKSARLTFLSLEFYPLKFILMAIPIWILAHDQCGLFVIFSRVGKRLERGITPITPHVKEDSEIS